MHMLAYMSLQFTLVHMHFWQAKELQKCNTIMLYGSMWAYVHTAMVFFLPFGFAFMGSPATPLHTSYVALAFFSGEFIGLLSMIQSRVLRVCAEVYESLFQ